MTDHRQGNDLAVLWSIFKDGEPFDLRGRSLKLYLKNLHERKEVVDFSVTGNEIHWTFYGKDQDTLGKHSLILVANEDEKGMITTDACDFVRLVSCSCKLQGGEDAPNVETQTIELESRVDVASGEVVTIVVDSELSETSVNPVQNKVITAEINKINTALRNKAEKSDIVTPDWNAQEGGAGYIENRTHYRRIKHNIKVISDLRVIIEPTENTGWNGKWQFDVDNWDIYPDEVEDLSHIEITNRYTNDKYKVESFSSTDNGVRIEFRKEEDGWHYIYDIVDNTVTVSCYGDTQFLPKEIKIFSYLQLDENFIPDTIARTEELEELQDVVLDETEALWENVDRIDGELTELSLQVGKVSEDVASKVEKGSLATINGQSIEQGGNIVIEGGGGEPSQYIKDATTSADGNTLTLIKKDNTQVVFSPSGSGGGGSADLSAIAKWGVLTQTLKQVGNANDGYVVQVSNPTYGWIPQSFIDEVTNFGGIATNANAGYITSKPIFNETTGYFEYQGITNLAYDEVRAAYTVGRNMFSNGIGNYLYAVQYRDNITSGVSDKFRCILHYPIFNEMGYYRFHGFCRYLKFLEIGVVNEAFGAVSVIDTGLNYAFTSCATLRSCGYFEVSQLKSTPSAFTGNPSIEEVYLKGLKVNINFGSSPLLKEECILYMIQNAGATGITITLHPTAYARAMADAEIVAAMESKQVNLAKA